MSEHIQTINGKLRYIECGDDALVCFEDICQIVRAMPEITLNWFKTLGSERVTYRLISGKEVGDLRAFVSLKDADLLIVALSQIIKDRGDKARIKQAVALQNMLMKIPQFARFRYAQCIAAYQKGHSEFLDLLESHYKKELKNANVALYDRSDKGNNAGK